MAEYILDRDLIAKLIFAPLPHRLPYTIATDRTNWRFAQVNTSSLVLSIVYKVVVLAIIASIILNTEFQSDTDIFGFLLCT